MRKVITGAAALALAAAGFLTAPAQSAVEVCYDVDVNIADQLVVDEEGCQGLPEAPEVPPAP